MLAGVMEGAAHRYRVQTPRSVTVWGLLVGESMPEATLRLQGADVARMAREAADAAMDTRETRLVTLPLLSGPAKVLFVPEGETLFAKWAWVTEPTLPSLDHVARLLLAAEHLDRLAWALRTGRELPHYPAGLTPASRAAAPER